MHKKLIPLKTDEEYLHKGVHAEIRFADGSEANSSYDELFARADFLASIYGIGNHKTLSSFIQMINEEDPIVIAGLIHAAIKRLEAMYSGKSSFSIPNDSGIGFKGKLHTGQRHKFDKSRGVVASFEGLLEFLSVMGATEEEIKEVRRKRISGELKGSDTDYSWITPETLSRPDFPIKEVLRQMKEDGKKCVNIKVSETKRQEKLRRLHGTK